jgi:hypothetical protein
LTLTPSNLPPVSTDGVPEHDLAHHLSLFAGVTVLVLGDVMLDRYVLGDVRRISPEAPIPAMWPPTCRRWARAPS